MPTCSHDVRVTRTQSDAAAAMMAAIAQLHTRHAHETRALQTELHVVSRESGLTRGGGGPRTAAAHCSSGLLELRRMRQALERELQQQSLRHIAAQKLNQHRLEQLFSRQVRVQGKLGVRVRVSFSPV